MRDETPEIDLMDAVSKGVLIPSFSVLMASGCAGCFLNSLFNSLKSSALRRRLLSYWKPYDQQRQDILVGAPIEIDPMLSCGIVYAAGCPTPTVTSEEANNTLIFSPTLSSSNVIAVNETVQDSMQHVRQEAQRLVFPYNPKYMILTTVKSLTMLVVLQYHYNYRGGWDRLAVCSAANLMSGLLTPVLEYAAGLLLPLDSNRNDKAVEVEPEEPKDSVLIVEVLLRIGQLELEDLETVLIQGTTFIIFGAVLLPAAAIFCVAGFAAFVWLFAPLWLAYALLRFVYYRSGGLAVSAPLPQANVGKGASYLLSTPAGEFAKAAFLKVTTLFLLQWTVQCSFLFGFVLLDGGSYRDALRLETEYQLKGWYDPREMTRFQWLCFASQLFF